MCNQWLKIKQRKKHVKLYIVQRIEDRDKGWMVNCGTHTKHTLLFNYNSTTLDKKKLRKAPVDEGKGV